MPDPPPPPPPSVFETVGGSTGLSADGTSDRSTINYMVTGTTSKSAALSALIAEIAPGITVDSRPLLADAIQITETTPGIWSASLDYSAIPFTAGSNRPKAVGESTFNFDGAGSTTLLTHAIAQTKYGTAAPDYGNAIDVDDDGVRGVEIVVPSCSFTIRQKFAGSSINFAWLRDLIISTGTVNNDAFLGFAAGEVLFLGPSGSQPIHYTSGETPTQGPVDIEFRFAGSPNLASLTIGAITGIAKPGHDYLWIRYAPAKEGQSIIRRPIGVYVAQVYRRTAFSALGIANPDTNPPIWG